MTFAPQGISPKTDEYCGLYKAGVIRIYDVLFPAQVLLDTDTFIRDFLVSSGMEGPVSSAELHEALGDQDAAPEKLVAEYHNGVLEITAPVTVAALPRKVEIKTVPVVKQVAA